MDACSWFVSIFIMIQSQPRVSNFITTGSCEQINTLDSVAGLVWYNDQSYLRLHCDCPIISYKHLLDFYSGDNSTFCILWRADNHYSEILVQSCITFVDGWCVLHNLPTLNWPNKDCRGAIKTALMAARSRYRLCWVCQG